jgi:tetratricopeptide (TPR) repeat protein
MSKKKIKPRLQTKKRIAQKSEVAAPKLPARQRYIFTGVMLLFPFVTLAVLELGLRAAGYGNNLQLARKVEEKGKTWWEINPNVGQRYFGMQPEFARQAEEARIAFVKPANGFRVICLGESSMAGFPYNKNATMPGILRTYLQQLFPDREIEVVNLGIAATNSFTVRDLMREAAALEPDAILIYVGHNEFYGAFGVGSAFSLGGNRSVTNLYLRLLRFRSFYLLQQGVRKIMGLFKGNGNASLNTPVMQEMARQQTIPYGSKFFTAACEIFERNLSEVLQMAKAAAVPVVVGNLVSNLKDHPPFASAPNAALSREEKGRWQEAFTAGVQLMQAGQHQSALEKFALAARLDSTDAELSFYAGKSALASGDTNLAVSLFSRARDLDLLRFRAPDIFNAIIKNVCQENAAPLADVENAFRLRSAGGIIGREFISEHLHPTVLGYALMAKAFLQKLGEANLLPAPIDSARLAALPENLESLNITVLDQEIGRLRVLNLTSAWPFKRPVNLPVTMEAAIAPVVQEIAARYINRQIGWGEAHLALAEKLTQMKKHEAALAEYRALAHEYPDEHAVFDNIGETLISLQRYEEALAAFTRSIALNANSASARAGAGKALMFLSRFQEAEAAFAEAVRLDDASRLFAASQRSFVFYLWGGALTNLRQYTEAEKKFVEALRLDPGNTLAENFLATLRARLSR